MIKTIILASKNVGKQREFFKEFAELPYTLMIDPQLEDVEESGKTFVENALLKARHATQYSGLAALADDSGLTVDALHGAPGIYSARYSGASENCDAANIEKLLNELQDVPNAQRTAHFHCCLVYMQYADDPAPLICHATWPGIILKKPQGNNGFGYDPIFYVPTHQCSAAELEPNEKNRISHRGRALLALLQTLG